MMTKTLIDSANTFVVMISNYNSKNASYAHGALVIFYARARSLMENSQSIVCIGFYNNIKGLMYVHTDSIG